MSELKQYFEYKCRKGMKELGYAGKPEYEDRLSYEIGIIQQTGFTGYFLILKDILDWARSVGVPCGPGRGSAAGSLAVHCLGITNRQLDPIRYGLLFERFLNPDRAAAGSPPDIDLDFCEDRRDDVIKHMQDTYGFLNVAHIGTYGTMKAKGAIRKSAQVLGHPYMAGDRLARLILQPIAGKAVPLGSCYEQEPKLQAARVGGGVDQEILEWAEKFEGQIQNFGTHAGGIILSENPISYHLPIYPGKDKKPTAAFEMNNVEEVGLVKFDILSIRALTTIDRCVKLVKENRGVNVDIDNIDITNEETYKQIQTGDVDGIFQFEGSAGMRDLILQIKPRNLRDIAAAVAIYRPGPLGSDHLGEYLGCRAGTATPTYLIPELEPILGETDGWLIYQEQILDIAKALASYTGGMADELRKAVGKKKLKLMQKHENLFREGMKENGFDESVADKLYHDIEAFAEYGFNKSVDGRTLVDIIDWDNDNVVTQKQVVNCRPGETVFSYDANGVPITSEIVAVHDHGKVPMWEVEFSGGETERCTLDHKWLTDAGMQPLWRILEEDLDLLTPKKRSQQHNHEDVSVWVSSPYSSVEGNRAQAELRGMSATTTRGSETKQNSEQQEPTHATNCLRNSQENIGQTRSPSRSSKTTKEMERVPSNRVRCNKSESPCLSKTIQDGAMAGAQTTISRLHPECPAQVWRDTETSRLCQSREKMGPRNRWTVAFSTGEWRRSSAENTATGQNAGRRDYPSWGLEVSATRYVELQGLRGTYLNCTERTNPVIRDYPTVRKQSRKVLSIKYLGMQQAYDLEVKAKVNQSQDIHNFVLSSGLVCSNSHALCYGFISYQMAYLRCHYPAEFICACLIGDQDEPDKIIKYINWCRLHNMGIKPPSVNSSGVGFTIENQTDIRFGLKAIKNVGAGARDVIRERKNGPYAGLRDFMMRINTSRFNRKKLESLISAGGFDEFGDTRAAMLTHVGQFWDHIDEHKRYEKKKETFDKRIVVYKQRCADIEYWQGLTLAQKKEHKAAWTALQELIPLQEDPPDVPLVHDHWPMQKKPGKMKEPEAPESPAELVLGPHPESPTLEILSAERELLSCYISGHPLDSVVSGDDITTLEYIKEKAKSGQFWKIVAVPAIVLEKTTKAKKKYASLTLEDKSGTIEAVMWPSIFDKHFHVIDKAKPIEVKIKTEVIEEGESRIVNAVILSATEIKTQASMKPRTTTTQVPVKGLAAIKSGEVETRLLAVGKNVTWDLGKVKIEGETND